jgi:hypothetical protein
MRMEPTGAVRMLRRLEAEEEEEVLLVLLLAASAARRIRMQM